MQIVIDIPEGTKHAIDAGILNLILTSKVWAAIKKGIPLPKHYGDLVDRNSFEYLQTLNDAIHGKMSWSDAILKIKYSAPTIIPATKGGDGE